MADTRIREIRLRKNYAMKYIAYHIGVSIQTISNWEQGKTEPDIKSLVKIADLFNVSLDYLLYRDDFKPQLSAILKDVETKSSEEIKLLTISFLRKIAEMDIPKKKKKLPANNDNNKEK